MRPVKKSGKISYGVIIENMEKVNDCKRKPRTHWSVHNYISAINIGSENKLIDEISSWVQFCKILHHIAPDSRYRCPRPLI